MEQMYLNLADATEFYHKGGLALVDVKDYNEIRNHLLKLCERIDDIQEKFDAAYLITEIQYAKGVSEELQRRYGGKE